MRSFFTKIHDAGRWLVDHQPALLFQLLGIAVTVAARYGLNLDAGQLLAVIAAIFGSTALATRAAVFSPATHEREIASVAAITRQATQTEIFAGLALLSQPPPPPPPPPPLGGRR